MYFLSNQLQGEVLRDLEDKMFHYPILVVISKSISWFGIHSKTFEVRFEVSIISTYLRVGELENEGHKSAFISYLYALCYLHSGEFRKALFQKNEL